MVHFFYAVVNKSSSDILSDLSSASRFALMNRGDRIRPKEFTPGAALKFQLAVCVSLRTLPLLFVSRVVSVINQCFIMQIQCLVHHYKL